MPDETSRPNVGGKILTTDELNQRYEIGDLPWDEGVPSAHLVELVDRLGLERARVLEVGCGTGTNAIWLAGRGFDVVAVDMSSKAIELATDKAAAAGVDSIRFRCLDLIKEPPVRDGSIDFVFDRGVFHSVSKESRAAYSERVYHALRPGGHWFSLCGNADERTEGRGPPRLTATEIVTVVERRFCLLELSASRFRRDETSALGWRILYRRRG